MTSATARASIGLAVELALNLRTATAIGLTVPPPVLVRADEIIR